jgi:flagellar protein FliO/FliZ
MKLRAHFVVLAFAAWPALVTAAEPAAPQRPFAAPSIAEVAPAPVAGLAQVTFSLLLVLAAVFAAGWLLRRARGLQRTRTTEGLAVVAEIAVGPRERVVLVEVAGERVLVGVAPGNVRALRHWPAARGGGTS